MIAEFEFEHSQVAECNYGTKTVTMLVSPTIYGKLRELVPSLPEVVDHDTYYSQLRTRHVADVVAVNALGVRVSVVKFHRTEQEKAVEKLGERREELNTRPAERSYNDKCHVHVPGIGLLLINEVRLLEDACTNTLQTELNDGWRIVACCPQPDSRRPDYILGRTKPC